MNSTLNYSDTNDKKRKAINTLDILKYGIFIIFSILISFVNIKFNNENIVIPISVAFVIAMIANDIPIGGVLVAEAITLGFRFGTGGFGIYIVEILMFILSIFILKPIEIKMDSEKYKLGKRVVIITIITSMLMYMKKYPFYAVCEFTIFSLCLEYIFYKIFSNGINVIKNFGKSKAYSEIEIISAGVFLAVAIIPLFGFHEKIALMISGILIMADLWLVSSKLKLKYGMVASIVFCLLAFIMLDEPTRYFAYFIFIGLFSTFINRMNKIIFFFMNSLFIGLVFYFNFNYKINLMILIEMLIGMMSLLFVRAVKKVDYTTDVKMLPEAMMEIEEKQDVEKEKRKEKLNNFKIKVKNAMSYNKTNILYDELYKNRNNILDDIFNVLDVSKSISDDEIIKILNDKKIYFAEEINEFDEEIQRMQVKGVTRLINNVFMNIK